jgi:hypothetical protein
LPEEWDSSAKYATSSSANNEGQRPPSGRGVTEDCSKAIEVDIALKTKQLKSEVDEYLKTRQPMDF